MPVPGYGGTLFTGASAGCIVTGQNIAPGMHRRHGSKMVTMTPNIGGVDIEVQAALLSHRGAECAGITVSWIIALLNDPQGGAANTIAFNRLFDVLRFQGAYVQATKHVITPKNPMGIFNAYGDAGLDAGVSFLRGNITSTIRAVDLPSRTTWAGFVSLGGHAVGVGRALGSYFIMDPNFGLFQFTTADLCARELQHLYMTYRTKKGHLKPMNLFFYKN